MIIKGPFSDPYHVHLRLYALIPNGATESHADELKEFARIHHLPWYPAPGPYPTLLLEPDDARRVNDILQEMEKQC